MAFNLSQDDFLALGRQLTDLAIAAFQQALVDHAQTVDVPAPTAHPWIETIVKQYGGSYVVADPVTLEQAVDVTALQAALVAKGVLTDADVTAAAAVLAQPVSAKPVSA